MIKKDSVVILPAHNEDKAIGKVIADILEMTDCHIVVSASGCTDNTVKIAKLVGQRRVTVLEAPKGKGRAIRHAFRNIDARKIVMMDADDTYPVTYINTMLEILRDVPVVIGARDLGIQPTIDRWGNRFITAQARILYGFPIRDLCTGMWAFRGNVVRSFNIRSYGFTLEAEMFVHVTRRFRKIKQIDIPYYPRIGDKKINRFDHLRIMWYLWSRRLRK